MSRAHLRIEDLGFLWPDGQMALEGVDLDVPAGSRLVLLGGSGAGKTTLLRLIAGLERPATGRVLLDDVLLSGVLLRGSPTATGGAVTKGVHVAPERRGIGVVFQALELWPHMSVAEHLAFALPGRPRGRRALENPEVAGLADQVGLPTRLLARRPANLSGGEQQRVAIARTLAAKPDVILYDEPLANLDPERRASLRLLIRELADAHGTTLVYVTHDPAEALELGDAVAVLGDGRVLEYGVPTDLYAQPTTLAGARALGPVVCLEGTVAGGRVQSALGTHAVTAPEGPCHVLWRPAGVRPVAAGGVPARVTACLPLGHGWQFQAELLAASLANGEGPTTVRGHAPALLRVGTTIQVAADAPAAVLPNTQHLLASGSLA